MLTSAVSTAENFVVLVSSRGEDHASLRNIFHGSQWTLLDAWNVSDGLRLISPNSSDIAVVICGYGSQKCDWKLVLEALDKMAIPPKLIVSYWQANEGILAEVLDFGAYDLLLGAPFDSREVLRMTQSAWCARNNATLSGVAPRKAVGLEMGEGRSAYGRSTGKSRAYD